MKFLTIRQPWAQLIAVGAKTIETRPFSTKYRGPLAIHAGKAWPVPVGEWQVPSDRGPGPMIERLVSPLAGTYRWEAIRTPLGAVVAVCDLVDVVPITPDGHCPNPPDHGWASHVSRSGVTGNLNGYWTGHTQPLFAVEDLSDQLPFGDFTVGRFAWLLDNVRPIDPVPMKGAQGLRDLPADVEDILAVRWAIGGGA